MAEPTTTNTGLIVPNTGDLPGTWGSAAINPDLVALDGYVGGVQTISAVAGITTLTGPSGFTPTPSGGPTQAQNAVLKFTGLFTSGDAAYVLPLPGSYIIDNSCTPNAGTTLILRAAAQSNQICIDYGEVVRVYNDGTNIQYVNFPRIGSIEIWAGLAALPRWVTGCTTPPYLLCDGNVYNTSTYPNLGRKLGSAFGGNGTTTFGVPDLRGRMALPYDGTGTRITSSGCGINGQSLGAAADNQAISLAASQIPTITGVNTNSPAYGLQSGTTTGGNLPTGYSQTAGGGGAQSTVSSVGNVGVAGQITVSAGTLAFQSNNTGNGSHSNVQPSQVTGIAVIRAA